jgi:hypothetical protein
VNSSSDFLGVGQFLSVEHTIKIILIFYYSIDASTSLFELYLDQINHLNGIIISTKIRDYCLNKNTISRVIALKNH